jgi:hypothetical protein
MKKTLTTVGGLLLALSAGAGLASADVSVGDVQKMIIDQLTPKLGTAPDSVVCPGGLATNVGAAVTCQVTAGGETHPVTVAVASVDPSGALSFSMQVSR